MTATADPPQQQPLAPASFDARAPAPAPYLLRLYITGTSARSARAIVNVRTMCDRHLRDCYELQVIDIALAPALARSEQLVAAPTLVKHRPLPVRRFIGDMSQTDRILRRLDLVDADAAA